MIRFYGLASGDYRFLSNFWPSPFVLDDLLWGTVENYYQAQKFNDAEYKEYIRLAKTPGKAKQLGRSRGETIRTDWEDVKEDVMRRALRAKFTSDDALREALLNTGDEQLVEDSPTDYYWGCGKNGSGKNRLGVLLMELRSQLREESK